MRPSRFLLMTAGVVAFVAGCGPVTYTSTRIAYKPYAPGETRQEREGVVAEIHMPRGFGPEFFATVQACDRLGRLVIDGNRNPLMEQISFVRAGQFWQLVALTNQTEHVLRLNGVAVRVFDPAGNQLEPLTKADLRARLLGERPCPSSHRAINQFQSIKVFDRNMEIVPGTTTTFWVPFNTPSLGMPGVWKIAVYDVPVRVDEAGRPTKTTRFEMRLVVTRLVDVYRRDNAFAPARLIETKEIAQ
jgi:hypothetical protein